MYIKKMLLLLSGHLDTVLLSMCFFIGERMGVIEF